MTDKAKRIASVGGSLLSTAIVLGCALMFSAWAIDLWRDLAPFFRDGERATGFVRAVDEVHTQRKGKQVTRYQCTVAYRGWTATFDARDRCDAGAAVQVVYRRSAPQDAILVPDASSVPVAILKSESGGRAIVALLLAATMLAVLLLPWFFPRAFRARSS